MSSTVHLAILLPGVHATLAYRKLIEKIELFTKYFFIVMCVTFVSAVFSALPYTIVRYYVLNMGKNSFYLFAPAWSVFTNELNHNRMKMTINFFHSIPSGFHSIGKHPLDLDWHSFCKEQALQQWPFHTPTF